MIAPKNLDGHLVYLILDALGVPRNSATRLVVDMGSVTVEGYAHDADGKMFLHEGKAARYVVSAKINWPKP